MRSLVFHGRIIVKRHLTAFKKYFMCKNKLLHQWSKGSVPSSHARGQRFEPPSRQFLFQLTEFVLVWACFNPSGILSTSLPLNRWPAVWFGSMLCGISMRLPGLGGDSNDGNPSHTLRPLRGLEPRPGQGVCFR